MPISWTTVRVETWERGPETRRWGSGNGWSDRWGRAGEKKEDWYNYG